MPAVQTKRTIAQARTYETAAVLQDKLAAQFGPMLSDKNSWGIESNLIAAKSFGHPVFDVVLCGQSQEPLRERMASYLEGLLSQQAAVVDDEGTE